MFEDTTLAAEVLANPASVQSLVLTEFQSRLGGTYSVADPNNTFNLLLEASSSINAQSVRYMESQFNAQYAVRATTSAELYNNMSDFDYLSMVAGPAITTLNLTFDVDYLIANAQAFDSTYNRVVIPVNTMFYVGPLIFGIYYPINININQITSNINVLWDTTNNNPLHTLSTNMVPFVQYNKGGLNLITLTIPVTQFALASTTYPVVSQQGFIQSVTYTDQFYAARVFTNLPAGGYTELAYTLSETVYDPTTPTAKLTIQNDTNTLMVSIPQVYFTNNQIGNQVLLMVYTTKGVINLDLTAVEVASCNINFNLGSVGVTSYSSILSNLATIDLTPAETVITGGSNALNFAQLRDLVVNGGLYTGVPVTPNQLTAYAAKQGFSISKYIDNVTNRIYYASNTITGGQNGYVMVTTSTIAIDTTQSDLQSTILNFSAESAITLLPTTIYSYNAQSNLSIPLTNTQLAVLKGMTGSAFATEVNNNLYTQTPFHIVTYTASQYPLSKSFNLMNPTVSAIRFIADNVLLTPQMSVVSAVVIHNANGTGGYTLRLGINKTSAMQAIAENNITVYLSANDANDVPFYGIATQTGTLSGMTIYELAIPTTYYLSQRGTFRSSMPTAQQPQGTTVDILLDTTFTVTMLINAGLYPNVGQDSNLIEGIIPPYNALLGVAKQQLDVVFGVDLSQSLYNVTNAVWSGIRYATYPETIYQTYPEDVYQTTPEGGLVYSIVNNAVQLVKTHSRGDHILDGMGNPIVQYAAGSVQYDGTGSPIVLANRQLQYYVNSMMFDLRLFYSSNTADISFVQDLPATLTSYFTTLTTVQSNLLEQTALYYKPNSTMGTATFSMGNNTPISLSLGFQFAFTAYVSQAVLDNSNLQAVLISDITTIVQQEMTKPVISLTDIAATVKTQLSDTILSIDVNGIDGTQTLQTVIIPQGTTTPIIAQELIYDPGAGTMALQSAIKVAFELAA